MRTVRPRKLALAVAAQAALLGGLPQLAIAQTGDEILLEEVVVTGSRREPRSVFDSAAPIDVLGGEEFRNQGGTDLTSLIRNVVPSFNVNTQPISDAATVVRPANLRGLAPDHTLVLVNGKRRHRAAVITWLGNGVSDNSQGPDLSPIPSIALKQVEVLRDGAAAQYGSDAIAGVMNFILKDDAEGGSVEVKYGEYEEGDGESWTVAGNIGLPFTDSGFFNVSFEYSDSEDTDRSVQRDDAQGLIDGGNTAVKNPAQIWGSPEVSDDIKTIFNLGLDLNDNQQFYAFGNYAQKEVDGGFYFRNPNTRGGVFGVAINEKDADGNVIEDENGDPIPILDEDGDQIFHRLVGDLTSDLSGNCPQNDVRLPDGSLDPNANVLDSKDEAGLAAVIADPNCYVMNELFPGGFTPRFGGDTEDASLVVGVRGNLANDLHYDISGSLGYNDADFFIYNTVNASLGPDTPTSFDPGDYTQTEKNFNIDLSYPLAVDMFASDLNIAAGFEWRNEEFEITVGDQASWEIGPLAPQGFSAASNGFPGFSPLASGDWDRSNIAAYVDLEADVTENWLVGVAFRWEDYDDFGSTSDGKVATHFQVTEAIGLRATYSTGFRAPTPGQSNAFNVSTEFDLSIGDLVNNGTIPPTSELAKEFGGQQLEPEESTNYTFGVVLQLGDLSLTVDYFNIEMEDRMAPSQLFELTEEDVERLLAEGITAAANIQNFRFNTNDFDTTTEGVDVVGTYTLDSRAGVTSFNLAYNYTDTTVDDFTPGIIDDTRILEMEEGLPETRWNLTGVHTWGNWRFMARYSYYDDWYDSEDGEDYDGYSIVDAEVAYSFPMGVTLSLGADNLLDEFPDDNPGARSGVGNKYSQFAPAGFNGRFMYFRAGYEF